MIMSAVGANAEITVKQYKARIESENAAVAVTTRSYIEGLGQGMEWANTAVPATRFFCPPPELALTVENFINIIDREIKVLTDNSTQEKAEGMWVGLVLLYGLQHTFPCDGK